MVVTSRNCGYPNRYPAAHLSKLIFSDIHHNILILLATPAGLEPATCRLEGGCSIQLSYGAKR